MNLFPDCPSRRCSVLDACGLCGFAFVEQKSSGKSTVKHYNKKLRVNEGRWTCLKKVVPTYVTEFDSVCVFCYKKACGILKLEKKIEGLRNEITHKFDEMNKVSNTTALEKRLLCTPPSGTGTESNKFRKVVKRGSKEVIKLVMDSSLGLPKVISTSTELMTKDADSLTGDTVKSLGTIDMSHLRNGEVEVSINYASGKKTVMVKSEIHRKICKALVRDNRTNETIIELFTAVDPLAIMKGAAKIVKQECTDICKRNSDSVLRRNNLESILSFNWEEFGKEIEIKCPGLHMILGSVISDVPPPISSRPYRDMMITAAMGLHGRSREMSAVHYLIGFVLSHGGCTHQTVERLCQIGLSTHPDSVQKKLTSWQTHIDTEVLKLKRRWETGDDVKYQLIGDNWDKNILPSYRTSAQKTESLHLFHVYAIQDRVCVGKTDHTYCTSDTAQSDISKFLPTITEQEQLATELVFILASSLIRNVPQLYHTFHKIYPEHLKHRYSQYCGQKTKQFPLGLFDCNENKTQELIQLLRHLSDLYVPCTEDGIVESVFFGGDRLTDERVQGAQLAMKNAPTAKERLEGFISKTEDFHRLMNFLEAICKMTYSTDSSKDRGTVHYYRNLLNLRNVKGHVKNSYRAYKNLYYTILDAVILVMFYNHFGVSSVEEELNFPVDLLAMCDEEKISWLNSVCKEILKVWFFNSSDDIFKNLRSVIEDNDHPENYWVSSINGDRFKCHVCDKSYAFIGSLKTHESNVHGIAKNCTKKVKKCTSSDQLQEYMLLLFKMTLLHKNLDSAVDMGDGERSVRSAKYELPIYHKTNKIKYAIGSIHLTYMVSGMLPADQRERFIANRFVNLQGGQNNNIALDEYLEMLNRDSKVACSGYKTKDSIIRHSKQYPILSRCVKHIDVICDSTCHKGFHNLPSYTEDVQKVTRDLLELNILQNQNRSFMCKSLICDSDVYSHCVGLSTVIMKHKPAQPFRRLGNVHL